MAVESAALSHFLRYGCRAVLFRRIWETVARRRVHDHATSEGVPGRLDSCGASYRFCHSDADRCRLLGDPDVDVQSPTVDRAAPDRADLVWPRRQQRDLRFDPCRAV